MRTKLILRGVLATLVVTVGLVAPAGPAAAVEREVPMFNLNSGLVIAVKGASTANGASVIQYPYLPTVSANEIRSCFMSALQTDSEREQNDALWLMNGSQSRKPRDHEARATAEASMACQAITEAISLEVSVAV